MAEQTSLPPKTEMQRAYLASDSTYDGVFFLGVKTTGIFCKPSCPARKPQPKNVEYFQTQREAIFAGYRPCKRCKPMEPTGKHPDWVERLIAKVESNPIERIKDYHLREMKIDPARARRYFLKNFGMTFHAYCRGRRLGKSFEQIRSGANLDDVVLGNGYDSHSGFREAFAKTFGKPPGKSRNDECIISTWVESPLGSLIAGATSEGICLLEFSDRRMLETQFIKLRRYFKLPIIPGENSHTRQLKEELKEYFNGTRTTFSLKLVAPGSPFQQRVWNELLKIPYGKTLSYEDIARRVGSQKAVRAVGTANGMNRIGIVIPCHRVVNKNGELGGYGGGLWRKKFLLSLERGERQTDDLFSTTTDNAVPDSEGLNSLKKQTSPQTSMHRVVAAVPI